MRAIDRIVPGGGAPVSEQVTEAAISGAISRMRARVGEPHDPRHAASVLASVLERWRERDFAPRRAAVAQISAGLGFSAALLDASFDALLAPFTLDALRSFAADAAERREIIGFIMAGNAPGAGLHEVAIALICGSGRDYQDRDAGAALFRRARALDSR